ncbi:MAG: hypothetical protein RIT81_41450 [Deltaproteobacteria bacterium]
MARPSYRLLGLFCGLVLAVGACTEDDAGVCCKVIPGGDETLIPEPEQNDEGDFRDVVAQHPAFDCSGLVCVSTQGSPAYCTHPCRDAGDCPEGFACEPILQSEPPPGSQLTPDDKFCVQALDTCRE